MFVKTLVASIFALGVLAVGAGPAIGGSSADSLSIHERYALWGMFYSRTGCVDVPVGHCAYSPARMKFASDYGQPRSVPVAYAVVNYRDYANGRQTGGPGAMLFMFATPTVGGGARWKYIGKAMGGKFTCGINVLDNPNYGIDQQIRVLKRIVSCS